jgi:hypothetical protein
MHILFLPNASANEKTKRAFSFPLFALAKKRINFPPLNCIKQNHENKKAQHITLYCQNAG